MIIYVSEYTNKEYNISFDNYITVPSRFCKYNCCDKCRQQFDTEEFKDKNVIIAYKEGFKQEIFHFCLDCFKGDIK